MTTRIEAQSFLSNPIVVIGIAVFVGAFLLNFYTVVVGVIVVSTFAGLWYKISRDSGLLEAFHMGNTILILLTAICLSIPFILADQVTQDTVARLALPSLILALLTIVISNLANLTNERKHANMNTKVTTICKNTQLILNQITLIQQSQFQQNSSPIGGTSESHNGDGVEGTPID